LVKVESSFLDELKKVYEKGGGRAEGACDMDSQRGVIVRVVESYINALGKKDLRR
jgi:hypothetical protein